MRHGATGLFDFTLVGLGALSVGLITILVMLKYLPDNGKSDQEVVPFYLEGKVQAGSKLIGRTVEENGLRELKDLFLGEIIRDNQRICAVTPQQIIKQTTYYFCGRYKISPPTYAFRWFKSSARQSSKDIEHLVEVVVSQSSKFIGKTVKEARFREQFHAAVIAIRRGHDRLQGGLGQVRYKQATH